MKKIILLFAFLFTTFIFAGPDEDLIRGATVGDTARIKKALADKADVNARAKFNGTTALMHLAGGGHAELVKLLIKAKADVNAKDNQGRTALQFAQNQNHAEIVKLLRAAGATE